MKRVAAVAVVIILVVVAVGIGLELKIGVWANHRPIEIYSNSAFNPDNGVVSGSGTESDPYVLEGWRIEPGSSRIGQSLGIAVRHTTAFFVIRNVSIKVSWYPQGGISIEDSANGRIESCSVSAIRAASVSVTGSSRIQISNSTLSSRDYEAVGVYDSNMVDLLNCDITHVTSYLGDVSSISCRDSTSVRVSGCSIDGSDVLLTNVSGGEIFGNRFIGDDTGLVLQKSFGIDVAMNSFSERGIRFDDDWPERIATNRIVGDNKIGDDWIRVYSHFNDAVVDQLVTRQLIVINCQNMTFRNASISRSSVGMFILLSTEIQIENCAVSECSVGISLISCSEISMNRNRIERERVTGISLERCRNASIANNLISGTVSRDTFYSYGYGLKIEGGSGIAVYHNDFIENHKHAYCSGLHIASWDAGYPAGGNYWSGFEPVDMFGGPYQDLYPPDGIVDNPVYIQDWLSSTGTDRYPLVDPVAFRQA